MSSGRSVERQWSEREGIQNGTPPMRASNCFRSCELLYLRQLSLPVLHQTWAGQLMPQSPDLPRQEHDQCNVKASSF